MTIAIDLSNKVALITGGGTGLGEQMCHTLAQAGAKIVIAGRRMEQIERVAQDVQASGGEAVAIATDVSDADSVDALIQAAEQKFGGIDILINNAAIYPSKPVQEVSVAEWDEVFAVNARGYFICAKAVLPHMQANRWGRIVNISSITYYEGFKDLIHYVSTKGAAIGFTRALAREVGVYGITVNSVAPGAIPTAAEEIHPDREGYNRHVLEHQSLKRRGTPQDIANAVLFFASDLSSFISGQSILVDGGWANS